LLGTDGRAPEPTAYFLFHTLPGVRAHTMAIIYPRAHRPESAHPWTPLFDASLAEGLEIIRGAKAGFEYTLVQGGDTAPVVMILIGTCVLCLRGFGVAPKRRPGAGLEGGLMWLVGMASYPVKGRGRGDEAPRQRGPVPATTSVNFF